MAQESWKREQEAGCQPPDGPVLCAKNCGFFGSAATMNMCSKCYRDHVLQQTKEAARTSAAASVKHQQPKQFESSHQHISQGVEPMDVDGTSASSRASELPSAANKSDSEQGAGSGSKDAAECLRCPEEPVVDETSLACTSPLVSAHPPASESTSGASTACAATAAPASASSVSVSPPKSQPNRCACCKKRVGLTGFKCRCEKVFCSAHRYSDKHDCSFDYKAAARNAIARANPVVRAEKINKI